MITDESAYIAKHIEHCEDPQMAAAVLERALQIMADNGEGRGQPEYISALVNEITYYHNNSYQRDRILLVLIDRLAFARPADRGPRERAL